MERHSHDRGEPSVTEAKGLLDPAAFIDEALGAPELVVHTGNLPATAVALRDLLAKSARFTTAAGPSGSCRRRMAIAGRHRRCRSRGATSLSWLTSCAGPSRSIQRASVPR